MKKKEEKEARQNGGRSGHGHEDGGKEAWQNGGQSGGKNTELNTMTVKWKLDKMAEEVVEKISG